MADNEIRREVEESGIDSTQPIVEEGSTTVEQIKTPWWKKVWAAHICGFLTQKSVENLRVSSMKSMTLE